MSLVQKLPQVPIQNLSNLSLQLKELKQNSQQQHQIDSKASTPSTESNATAKPSTSKQHQKYSSIFSPERYTKKSVFQNASKNILTSSTRSEKQLRTNSASPQPQLKNLCNMQMKQESLQYQQNKNQFMIQKEDISQHPFRHLVRGNQITRIKFLQFLDEIQSQLKFSKLLKAPAISVLRNKKVKLPESNNNKPTLVLDMDETLIHSVFNPRLGKHSVQVNSRFQKYQQFFNIRPYAQEFLKEMSEIYEIIIFSASVKEYVTSISNYLDPQKQFITRILSRDNCYITPTGYLIKDLRVLENRDLSKVIIVDNLALCFAFQQKNGIPILPWIGDIKDEELKYLADYLKLLAKEENLAEANYANLKLNALANQTKSQIYHPK